MLLKHPHSGLKVLLTAGLLSLAACQSPGVPQMGSVSASNQSSGTSLYNQLGSMEFSPDGRWLLWSHSTFYHNGGPSTELGWYVFDRQSGKQRELWTPDRSGSFTAKWAGNGQLITLSGSSTDGNTTIRQFDPATDISRNLWQGKLDATNQGLFASKGQVAWISDKSVHLFKLSENQPRRLNLPDSEAFVRGIAIIGLTDDAVLLRVQKPQEQSGTAGFKTLLTPPPASLYDLYRLTLADGKILSLARDLDSVGDLSPDGRHIPIFGKSGPRLIRTSDGSELQGFPELSASENSNYAFWLDADRLLYWTSNGQQLRAYTVSKNAVSNPLPLPSITGPYNSRAYAGRIIYQEGLNGNIYGGTIKSAELKPDGQLGEIKTLLEADASEYMSFLYNANGPLLYQRSPEKYNAGTVKSIGLAETGQVLFVLPSAGDKAEALQPQGLSTP